MKNKMLIEIFVPASGETFEFWIPRGYRIAYVNQLLVEFFLSHSQGGYVPDKGSVLCDRKSGRIINGSLSMDALEKMDNPRLMLI